MTNNTNIRAFTNSADARAAGFTTLEWLRAFSTQEHIALIQKDSPKREWGA